VELREPVILPVLSKALATLARQQLRLRSMPLQSAIRNSQFAIQT
jgi:hypothetical protein